MALQDVLGSFGLFYCVVRPFWYGYGDNELEGGSPPRGFRGHILPARTPNCGPRGVPTYRYQNEKLVDTVHIASRLKSGAAGTRERAQQEFGELWSRLEQEEGLVRNNSHTMRKPRWFI